MPDCFQSWKRRRGHKGSVAETWPRDTRAANSSARSLANGQTPPGVDSILSLDGGPSWCWRFVGRGPWRRYGREAAGSFWLNVAGLLRLSTGIARREDAGIDEEVWFCGWLRMVDERLNGIFGWNCSWDGEKGGRFFLCSHFLCVVNWDENIYIYECVSYWVELILSRILRCWVP